MNRRGSTSIAALGLAAVVGAAAMSVATHARRRERASSLALAEARARLIVVDEARGAVDRLTGESGDSRIFEVSSGTGTLRVEVFWKKVGGRYRAVSWREERR